MNGVVSTYRVTFDRPARERRPGLIGAREAAGMSTVVTAENWPAALALAAVRAGIVTSRERIYVERRRREPGDALGVFRCVTCPAWSGGGGVQIGSGWRTLVVDLFPPALERWHCYTRDAGG